MLRELGYLIGFVALTVFVNLSQPRAQEAEYAALPGAGAQVRWETGPLLVCWQAQRLIDALQPGVQGLPDYCTALHPPVTFMLRGEHLWATTLQWQGAPILVGVYEITIVGRVGVFYTALTARPQ